MSRLIGLLNGVGQEELRWTRGSGVGGCAREGREDLVDRARLIDKNAACRAARKQPAMHHPLSSAYKCKAQDFVE